MPRRPRLPAILAAALLSLVPMLAQPAPGERRALVPEDFYRILDVGDPQVSADGQWVAYLVTTNDRESDETRTALWMVSWDGTQHVQLTSGLKDAATARWSPDGSHLAFIATPAGAEQATLMTLDRRGGEPRAVGRIAGTVTGYTWAPVFISYGRNNRTHMLRIPTGSPRVESRAVDTS